MSWLFSQALVAAYSEANSSDGGLCALLRSMPSPQAFSSHGRTMVASLPSQYGMISERLTAFHGEELLTWFREDSRVRTSLCLAPEPASLASGPAYGVKCPGSLARFDLDSSSWKTLPPFEGAGSQPWWGTWPAWGMMRDGVIYPLPGSARPTKGIDSGLWPTPVASCRSGYKCGPHHEERRKLRLNHYCFLRGRSDLAHSPTFREWMMGWPEGWTRLKQPATARFQQWSQRRGIN
jgi:hypothetical protein